MDRAEPSHLQAPEREAGGVCGAEECNFFLPFRLRSLSPANRPLSARSVSVQLPFFGPYKEKREELEAAQLKAADLLSKELAPEPHHPLNQPKWIPKLKVSIETVRLLPILMSACKRSPSSRDAVVCSIRFASEGRHRQSPEQNRDLRRVGQQAAGGRHRQRGMFFERAGPLTITTQRDVTTFVHFQDMCINCGKCYMACNDSGYQAIE
jgi:NAD-dependent dihydropyrimidine dehydrogenase PreA subunit